MRTFSTLIAAAVFALGVGFASTVQAADQTLVDGDAESGLTNWNTSGAEVQTVNKSSSGLIPSAGNHTSLFFSLGEAAAGIADLDQDVSATDPNAGVWGCGVEGLQGSYRVDGLGASADTDPGTVTATFVNPLGIFIADASVAAGNNSGNFLAFVLGTNLVPENSADMNVELGGALGGGDTNGLVDVGYDDVSVTLTDCLASFAKISGRVMGTGGNRGQWSFEGSVGILHDGGGLVFSDPFSITYKNIKTSCDITPTALSFEGTTAVVTADYACVDKEGDASFSGTGMTIRLVPGTGGSNGGGNVKDRGDVCVDAPDNELDIPTVDSLCDDDGDATALKNGNVHTDDDTSNGP